MAKKIPKSIDFSIDSYQKRYDFLSGWVERQFFLEKRFVNCIPGLCIFSHIFISKFHTLKKLIF